MWLGPDWPTDQRDDDARSLTFDTDVLDTQMMLLGAPIVNLKLKSNQPDGQVIARLCDIGSDGESTLITYGVLNLTHRHSHQVSVEFQRPLPQAWPLGFHGCGRGR